MKNRFLLADDDADDANIFCEALTRIAPRTNCFTVENGRALFDLLSEARISQPDIIFLDINMPVMNGWECLKKLKNDANYRSIPAVMYSTSSAKKDIEMAYNLGALFYLTKPEDFHELCKILEVVVTNPDESLIKSLSGFDNVKLN